jgi:beta-galactosidase
VSRRGRLGARGRAFDLDWLEPVLDGAHARGIGVVLGTPTYAVPPWLARRYPEIALRRITGERVGWGARQEMDHTHPAYRFHAERVVRAVVGRYHAHPAVIGFQVDNEPGVALLYNHGVFESFVDDLRRIYGDVETLNREWGLVYWSHQLSTWADLWTPLNNQQPQYDLAWRRFQARLTTELVAWQAGIVRGIVEPEKFVTTCISYGWPGVDDPALTKDLDVTAGNPYYATQEGLAVPSPLTTAQTWVPPGTPAVFLSADRMFSSRQDSFLVTETVAGPIGYSHLNLPAYDGQLRQVAWALVARGARMIEYWHWHTLHFGAETYWGGILPHDQQPGRIYAEIARLGAELKAADAHLRALVPDAAVGLVWSKASEWGLAGQPALVTDDGDPDPGSYQRIVESFYRGAFDAGLPVRILHDVQLSDETHDLRTPAEVAAELPVLLVPALYIASDHLLDWLRRYAQAGGHLVLGPRSAYADPQARARVEVKPARLSDAAAVDYQELSSLFDPVGLTLDGPLAGAAGARATLLADGLRPREGAQVLARYDHPHHGAFAAVTTAAVGRGRVTTVGTVPDPRLAGALLRWAVPAEQDAWRALVDGPVTVTSATAGDRRIRVLHNWSWSTIEVQVPTAVRDALDAGAAQVPGGGHLQLGPWDVRVLVEAVRGRGRGRAGRRRGRGVGRVPQPGHPRLPPRPERVPGRRRLLPGHQLVRVLPGAAGVPQHGPGELDEDRALSLAPDQVDLSQVPTSGGIWAPTIRHHDGVFYVITTVMDESRFSNELDEDDRPRVPG